ncbi:MHS family MFS transporter [Saccharopolyspora sp. K220]|uniref:MFS transporter n=1 Tax=Saccharopolyspora soli TaxID=2926618 RepID=UPI001F561BE3|nr:MFS transporter [Saccharopolyspora soli]MCI2418799.1 MHS family MFS transporter [Saccharopolyspora soli]
MSAASAAPRELSRSELRRVLVSSVIGTAVEWYDFYLFAISSSVVFGQLFFPQFDETTGTISAFATFAIGFFVRPLGGAFFGHFGDRIGRKNVLVITLIMMGVASTLIGLLPTYASVGIWGAVLLTLLRAAQGFGAGAEYGGAVLMLAETAPVRRRGFYSALPYTGVAAGLIMANGVYALMSGLPEEEFLSWGWRIPFLLSIVGVAIGLVMRLRLHETPVFQEIKQAGQQAKRPIVQVFRRSWRNLLCAWGAQMGDKSLAYIFESLVIVYVTDELGLPEQMVLTGLLVASAIQFVTIPAFAALSDRIGRRPVYILGAVLSALFAYPFFLLLDTGSTLWIWLSIIFASGVAKTMMTAAQAGWFAEMFPSAVRYSGFALAREGMAPLSGGLAPLISASLLALGGGSPHWVVVYIAGLAVITTVSVWLGPETRDVDMFPEAAEDARAAELPSKPIGSTE